MLQTIGISRARNDFFNIVNHVQKTGQSVTVIKNNIPAIIIAPYKSDYQPSNLAMVLLSTKGPVLTSKDVKNYQNIRKELKKRAELYDSI